MVRFGVFEVDLQDGELRKQGLKIKLQEQPFRVLTMLLDRSGQVVTRDELRKQLWNEDTFVDFDQGLNKAINRLREALNDSAENPRFIETIPKRGYRFIAPIEQVPNAPGADSASNPANGAIAQLQTRSQPPASRSGREKLALALAALFLATSVSLAVIHFARAREPAQQPMPMRTSILPPPGNAFLPYSFALSPDGTRLAFVAVDPDGKTILWIRPLAEPNAQRLDGTEGATYPFWSMDNRHIGFFAQRRLKSLDPATGAIRVLADAPSGHGGTWNSDGIILFTPSVAGPLYRIRADEGVAVPITQVREGSGQSHCLPSFLPDGKHFLFYVFRSSDGDSIGNGLYIGDIGSPVVHLLQADMAGSTAYSSGYLLHVRDRGLVAQPFDANRLRLMGSFFPIAQQELDVERTFSAAGFTVSENGVIVFQSTLDSPTQLAWFDRSGSEIRSLSDSPYKDPSFSPDGRYLAVSSDDARNGKHTIRVYDLERGVSFPLTEAGDVSRPIWSSNGKQITYALTQGKISYLCRIPADGSGIGAPPEQIRTGPVMLPNHWSGDQLVFQTTENGLPFLYIYSDADGQVRPFIAGAEGQFSPNGKWIAYIGQGGVAGGGGIVVQPFPGPGPHTPISGTGGAQPRWSHDGHEIFYMAPDRRLMSVAFDPKRGKPGQPQAVFQTRIVAPNLASFQYDVDADGHFVINSFRSSNASSLTVITGWHHAR